MLCKLGLSLLSSLADGVGGSHFVAGDRGVVCRHCCHVAPLRRPKRVVYPVVVSYGLLLPVAYS